MKNLKIYTGCYSKHNRSKADRDYDNLGDGICCYSMSEQGKLTMLWSESAANPTYLAIDTSKQILYAINEVMECDGIETSSACSYKIEPNSSELKYINVQHTGGTGACNVALSPCGTHLMVANYGGGSVCVLPVDSSGAIKKMSCFFQHYGKGINEERQLSPHVHQVIADNKGKYVLAVDLGTDSVEVYATDWEKGYLSAIKENRINMSPGSGPRMCTFNATGDKLYIITELSNEIMVYDYDMKKGQAQHIQTISTLPNGYEGKSWASCIKLHTSGKWLFASNRGHDSIALYSIHQNGTLSVVDFFSSGGSLPRDFDISPCGNFIVVGNQESSDLVVFSFDSQNVVIKELDRVKCNFVTAVLIHRS